MYHNWKYSFRIGTSPLSVSTPLTLMPSGSSLDFLGTRQPQLGSWMSRMVVSVVLSMEISASGWQFMFAEIIRMLSCIVRGS